MSEEIRDVTSLFFGNNWLGVCRAYNCEFEKALCHFEKALSINVAANSLWGISAVKGHISHVVHGPQGRLNLAYEASEEALRTAEQSGDAFSTTVAYASHGATFYYKGCLEEALKYLLKAADFDVPPWNSFAQGFLGKTYCDMGAYQKAKDHYGKAACFLEDRRILPALMRCNRIGVARAKVMNGEKDVDLGQLLAYLSEYNMKPYVAEMRRYVGEILLSIDDQHVKYAENWIQKAIEAARRHEMMWDLASSIRLYAELFKRKGDLPNASKNLIKAIEIFKECGADGWVTKYEEELAKLS